jgi:hypothetical protein
MVYMTFGMYNINLDVGYYNNTAIQSAARLYIIFDTHKITAASINISSNS